MKTSTPLGTIGTLEGQLAASLAGRAGTISAIDERITKAETVVAGFQRSPSTATIDKALTALETIEASKSLLTLLGDLKPWTASVQDQWLRDNFDVLIDALEAHVTAEASTRTAYREKAAAQVGALSSQIVLKDGNGATESELSALSRQLEEIEADLESREAGLTAAHDSLRDFKRARGAPPGGYEPIFKKWQRARDAVVSVSFEPEAHEEKKD